MVCLDATNYCSVLDAVYYDNDVVGHIPYNLAPKVSAFLKRDVNKGFAEITGMNHGPWSRVRTSLAGQPYIPRARNNGWPARLGTDWRSRMCIVYMDQRSMSIS